MKRFYLLVFGLIFTIGVNTSEAQSPLSGGFRVGGSLTNFSGDGVSGNGALTTFKGGFFLNYSLSEWFTLQPEANLSFKGATHELTLNNFPYHKISIVYAQLPVLMKFSAQDEWESLGIKPTIFVGPAVNFRLNKEYDGVFIEDPNNTAYSVEPDVKAVNYELVGGVGGTINNIYIIDLRYGYGLSDVFDEGDVKTSSIELTVGLKF